MNGRLVPRRKVDFKVRTTVYAGVGACRAVRACDDAAAVFLLHVYKHFYGNIKMRFFD